MQHSRSRSSNGSNKHVFTLIDLAIVGITIIGVSFAFTFIIYAHWGDNYLQVFYGPNATYQILYDDIQNKNLQIQWLQSELLTAQLKFTTVSGEISPPATYGVDYIVFNEGLSSITFKAILKDGVYTYAGYLKNDIDYSVTIQYSRGWGAFYAPDMQQYKTSFYLQSPNTNLIKNFNIIT